MMGIDFSKVAKILVHEQARVKPGEVIQVTGGVHNLELVEEVAVEIRKAGGFPMVDIRWESLSTRLLNETPDEHLEQTPEHQIAIEGLIDGFLSLSPAADPRKLASIDPAKSRLVSKSYEPVHEANVKRGARRIGAGFPTPAQAEMYGLPFERFHEMFWKAALADREKILELCSSVRERLRATKRVEVISPEGDRLSFSIEGRRINMDDGEISEDDLATGDVTANFPFGEVYCAPIEETVEGVARFPVVFHKAQEIRGLKLVYEDGKVVSSSAETNHALFEEAMGTHTGDKFRLGELGIGTNHEVHEPTGNTLLDEKIFGAVHLAIGENRSYGGMNASSCHWDMVVLDPTLTLDGEPLMKDGKFV